MNFQDVLEGIEKYKDIVFAIITLITIATSYFRKKDLVLDKKQEKYFNYVLNEYFKLKAYYPSTLDSREYFRKLKFRELCIPAYVFYAAEYRSKDDFEKIIKVDYWSCYPSISNNIIMSFDNISKLFTYILYWIVIFSFAILETIIFELALKCIVYFIFKYISIFCLISIFIMLILLSIGVYKIFTKLIVLLNNNSDSYSLNIEIIEKIISKKVDIYNKKHDKYYI